ncbi:GerMN domain-containing protein [Patescibacteria group bacterium]|nr:GerMN domain-containing protein [Patescibacteria group bacterium]
MNLKYILIVVILAVIVGGGILGYQYLLVPKEESKMPEVKPPEAPPEESKEIIEVRVYFVDKQMMIEGKVPYPDMVKPLSRIIPKTEGVAMTAMNTLLEGPTLEEQNQYVTSIPVGVEVKNLRIEKGIAYINFNEALNKVAGSATVSTIRTQIEKTLKQFSTVDKVVISIEGETEAILQP